MNEILRLIGSHNLLATPTAVAAPRSRAAAADRRLPARREGDRRRGADPHLPPRVGLRGLRARRPQRAVRALLSRFGRAQPRARPPGRAEGARARVWSTRFLEEEAGVTERGRRGRQRLDRALHRRSTRRVAQHASPTSSPIDGAHPRRGRGGRRGRGRRRGRRGARRVPGVGGARAAGAAADPQALRARHPRRAPRSSRRSRPPTTARCSSGNLTRVVPRAALNIEFFADLRR